MSRSIYAGVEVKSEQVSLKSFAEDGRWLLPWYWSGVRSITIHYLIWEDVFVKSKSDPKFSARLRPEA